METKQRSEAWAALMELMAGATVPGVAFLNPSGMESPEAICRCVCDSVVRAPMADQQIKSAMYCGVIGSRSSVAVGTPRSMTSRKTRRAIRNETIRGLDRKNASGGTRYLYWPSLSPILIGGRAVHPVHVEDGTGDRHIPSNQRSP